LTASSIAELSETETAGWDIVRKRSLPPREVSALLDESTIGPERQSIPMTTEDHPPATILVVEDVHETRDGIETLLTADGYRVASARDVRDAIESARRNEPDLILVSLAGTPREVIFSAISIRQRAEIKELVAVVVFCPEGVDEGDEVAIGENVHLTHPDNFNQLRGLIARLLKENSSVATGGVLTSA
jgi:CheY-like chemotaxis protein